ncbi:MAG: glycoside hydrolase family 92 protein, partial [Carboxylicivirga sp.]|nr:glycoside hydrolase family 92 protein [Carboxylicivirga sp.]
SWYVFSSMGFYPVNPANQIYQIGTPRFQKVVIDVPGNKEFIITTEDYAAGNIYVQEAYLNGQKLKRPQISHDDIMAGGHLHFVLGKSPNTAF